MDKLVKPEEPFINFYVNECLKYNSTISSTHKTRIILDTKYENDDLNKVKTEKYQQKNPSERENIK